MVTDADASVQTLSFADSLRARASAVRSWLCVGVDPDLSWLPDHLPPTTEGVARFCRSIIDETAPYAAAFKLNFAFFEVLGPAGWEILSEVRHAVPAGIPVIADAKRGDIGNTDRAY